jgi:ubiquinone/menaquinone biosynthesis C-methylase UbiE
MSTNIQSAYNSWAAQYDINENKTRDLEGVALQQTLAGVKFKTILEIGCGTGKNTAWLMQKSEKVTAVDFSEQMLSKARSKIISRRVNFVQHDISTPWFFTEDKFDLVTFSLVLEHISELDHVFRQATLKLNPGGYVYIGELHPFKQYSGSKARFETAEGLQVVECYNHHISDFIQIANKYGLRVLELFEYFDEENGLPRILVILFSNDIRK